MSAQFWLVTAFSNAVDGGNPAAVVFLDMATPIDTLEQIAVNLNQPIVSFVSASPLPSPAPKTVAFDVRWFIVNKEEVPLCGHGTLAAAKAVFDRDDVPKDTEVIEFHTRTRGIMTARRLPGGFIEIELPSGKSVDVSAAEHARISKVVTRAIGREVTIDRIQSGVDAFEHYLLLVLDEKENLRDLVIDATPLRESGRRVHIFTSQLSNGNERFVSRMFAPGCVPGDEDQVCGSAHCLMAPYWYSKFGIPSGQEIRARQVSPRGGLLKLMWEAEKNTLKLSGEVAVLGKGELRLA
ncbi:putative phenazine biosynthesis-like protein [Lyophyllum shimeji]|uniref:Phenazine biosynthesis-like protein n=1 Tax=Lyophyllum shimeji TaxID=47721 RepID=A0A9P3PGS4_LYOSH|nr:putative phenazine biosynthesis-like protein [Lyophyllum shimeji]